MIRIAIALAILGSVLPAAQAQDADPADLDWLTGCWQSETGDTREVWSGSEDGHYFGYSVVMSDARLVFFEQMRIDPSPVPTFNAYPSGQGPSAFPSVEVSKARITFANPDHDYPQKITYKRDGDMLRAVISKIDDRDPRHFDYSPCQE